jgi:hypothetical protein
MSLFDALIGFESLGPYEPGRIPCQLLMCHWFHMGTSLPETICLLLLARMQSAFLKTVHLRHKIIKLSAAGVAKIFDNMRNTVEEKG